MKILALTRYSRKGASSRLRFYQYIDTFARDGLDVTISPLLPDDYLNRLYSGLPTNFINIAFHYVSRLLTLFKSYQYDLLWIEKEIYPGLPSFAERILNFLGVIYVVDYDDAIFHNYDLRSSLYKWFMGNKISNVMRYSKCVICGNDYIAEYAKNAGSRQVELIPTVVDTNKYNSIIPAEDKNLIIGWIGTPSTVKYLDIVVPSLKRLSEEFPLTLCVIGANFSAGGLNVDCKQWLEDLEVPYIKTFDIGIMPLIDMPWERGKCGYKLIQYMACGIPVVASPVGVNKELVQPGVNGYLCTDDESWYQAFKHLALNSNIRNSLGLSGRNIVTAYYSLHSASRRLTSLFNSLSKSNN